MEIIPAQRDRVMVRLGAGQLFHLWENGTGTLTISGVGFSAENGLRIEAVTSGGKKVTDATLDLRLVKP